VFLITEIKDVSAHKATTVSQSRRELLTTELERTGTRNITVIEQICRGL